MKISDNSAIRIAILTISDRSSQGIRPDASGPQLAAACITYGWQVTDQKIVPDEMDQISAILTAWCDHNIADVILTTGGTGFTPRDITPEATCKVIERQVPGMAEAMRQESLKKTPFAMLSRGICGIRRQTLIINFPGSPKAALENLEVIKPVIPHAIELLRDSPNSERGHQFGSQQV